MKLFYIIGFYPTKRQCIARPDSAIRPRGLLLDRNRIIRFEFYKGQMQWEMVSTATAVEIEIEDKKLI